MSAKDFREILADHFYEEGVDHREVDDVVEATVADLERHGWLIMQADDVAEEITKTVRAVVRQGNHPFIHGEMSRGASD